MKHRILILILLISFANASKASSEGPIGWASVNAGGQNGTTGGAAGPVVTVSTLSDLTARANQAGPLQILIEGMIDLSSITTSGRYVIVNSNKTIQGAGPGAGIQNGGFRVRGGEKNIIFRNLNIIDGTEDGIQLNGELTHVWIDHCTFMRNVDGAVDITNGANYITLSYNLFADSDRASLIGSSDDDLFRDRYKVTYHHNWFNRTRQRHPRVRFGQVHAFNNYYLAGTATIYGIGIGVGAQIVSECNFFEGVSAPSRFYDTQALPGFFRDSASVLLNSGAFVTRPEGINWRPSEQYTYTLTGCQQVKQLVMEKAGAEPFSTNVPALVNNNAAMQLSVFPNPVSEFANIQIQLTGNARVIVTLFDISGRKISDIIDESLSAGLNTRQFERQGLSSGVYFIKIISGSETLTRKLVLQ